jgi:hypothetical protein
MDGGYRVHDVINFELQLQSLVNGWRRACNQIASYDSFLMVKWT